MAASLSVKLAARIFGVEHIQEARQMPPAPGHPQHPHSDLARPTRSRVSRCSRMSLEVPYAHAVISHLCFLHRSLSRRDPDHTRFRPKLFCHAHRGQYVVSEIAGSLPSFSSATVWVCRIPCAGTPSILRILRSSCFVNSVEGALPSGAAKRIEGGSVEVCRPRRSRGGWGTQTPSHTVAPGWKRM